MNAATFAFSTKNFSYFLQAAHHFDLHNTICSSCWLRCSLNSRWVLPITVFPKTSGRNQRKKPFGHFRANPSFSRNNCEVKIHHQSEILVPSWDSYQYNGLSKGSCGLLTQLLRSFILLRNGNTADCSDPNTQIRSHQMYLSFNSLQAPGHLLQKTRNPQKTFSLLTHLNYTHHVTRQSVPLSCHRDFSIKLFFSSEGSWFLPLSLICVLRLKWYKHMKQQPCIHSVIFREGAWDIKTNSTCKYLISIQTVFLMSKRADTCQVSCDSWEQVENMEH